MTHLPTKADIAAWPSFTETSPMRVLVSACPQGIPCGTDATSYGAPYAHLRPIFDAPNATLVPFCPEDFAFGTPREVPDIVGGNGFDVLDGRARVLSESGRDWTQRMKGAAEAMLEVARGKVSISPSSQTSALHVVPK